MIAILLLVIYLFNLAGYSLVFRYFIDRSEAGFIAQLDKEKYNDAELVQISIPLHLPYVQNNSGFVRVDGSVESEGIQYNYVKRKIHNDTLYIMCLPNQQKNMLVKGKSNYAGEVNDFGANKKEKQTAAKKGAPVLEYNDPFPQYNFASTIFITAAPLHIMASPLLNRAGTVPGHPPQPAC